MALFPFRFGLTWVVESSGLFRGFGLGLNLEKLAINPGIEGTSNPIEKTVRPANDFAAGATRVACVSALPFGRFGLTAPLCCANQQFGGSAVNGVERHSTRSARDNPTPEGIVRRSRAGT